MEKHVKVDGKTRTDPNFPAGFMDVVEIPKSNDQFRLIFDTKGRLEQLRNSILVMH
jgi:ribosomal protein S4E